MAAARLVLVLIGWRRRRLVVLGRRIGSAHGLAFLKFSLLLVRVCKYADVFRGKYAYNGMGMKRFNVHSVNNDNETI